MVFPFSCCQKRGFLVLEHRVLHAFKRVWVFFVLVFKCWMHHTAAFWESAFISKLDLLRSWDVRILRIKNESLRCRLISTNRNTRLKCTTSYSRLSEISMCIIVPISMCHHWLLTLHLKPNIKQKHIVLMSSVLLSLSGLLCWFLSLWNYQRVLHHLADVGAHVVSASFRACLVVVDYLGGWGFEWTSTCFITNSCMSRFPSYNRLINSVKGNHLMLLAFKWLQLVNCCFIKGKFFVVKDVRVQEFFELANSCSVILLLLKSIEGVLMEFISFSFIKCIDLIISEISIVILVVAWIYVSYLGLINWSWLRLSFTLITLFLIAYYLWHHWRIIKLLLPTWVLILHP